MHMLISIYFLMTGASGRVVVAAKVELFMKLSVESVIFEGIHLALNHKIEINVTNRTNFNSTEIMVITECLLKMMRHN